MSEDYQKDEVLDEDELSKSLVLESDTKSVGTPKRRRSLKRDISESGNAPTASSGMVEAIFQPLNDGEKYVDVGINGQFYRLPAYQRVMVPAHVAAILLNSEDQRVTIDAHLPKVPGGTNFKV
ncbi:MAG: hypothetical protein LBD02_01410 [Christensenellaceae bacterium]|jgi:hypothetical protein|nr:hypothetical protein [Christensenellaceae bacterium]